MAAEKLFSPFQLTPSITLQHRVVLAPLTRFRANDAHVHGELAAEYYGQRASVPGTLLITEATFIDAKAGGQANVPGIWSDQQVEAWKKVTSAVHSKGSFIYLQLWALGRAALPQQLDKESPSFHNDLPYVSASDIPLDGVDRAPRPLTIPEIHEYVRMYAHAADNAVNKAGFDGVEIHGANGYLLDQFFQDVSNKRTDEYGGSLEGRLRFGMEVVQAVTKAVGQEKVGIRLSPWGTFQNMRMDDPKTTFKTLVTRIRTEFPNFGYIHAVEPRVTGDNDMEFHSGDSNDFLREAWNPPNVSGPKRVYIAAGGFKRETAIEEAEKQDCLIAFGRAFLANPDLPKRLKEDLPLNKPDRATFYTAQSPEGYIDYPFASSR